MRILIPLPDTDFDVTEVAVPWRLLSEAGHDIVFATEQAGTVPTADPRLPAGVFFGHLGAESEPKAWFADLDRAPEFSTTIAWAYLDPAAFEFRGLRPRFRHGLIRQDLYERMSAGLRAALPSEC